MPAYGDWPCIVLVGSREPSTQRVVERVTRRNPGARAVVMPDDSGTVDAVVLLQPGVPEPTAATTPVPAGGLLYAVDRTDPRRFVGMVTFDWLAKLLDIRSIKALKIDVEGYEAEVFSGFDFSARYAPRNIIMEYYLRHSPDSPGASQEDLNRCVALLRAAGYSPHDVTGAPYTPGAPLIEDNIWWRRPG